MVKSAREIPGTVAALFVQRNTLLIAKWGDWSLVGTSFIPYVGHFPGSLAVCRSGILFPIDLRRNLCSSYLAITQ